MRAEVIHSGTPPQMKLWSSPSRVRLYIGGVGSGKTRAGLISLLKAPGGTRCLVIAPTYPMLRDAIVHEWLHLFKPLIKSHNMSHMETLLINGSSVLWRSAENPDRLRGPNIGLIWIDEGASIRRGKETFDIAQGRLRLSPGRILITSTPKGKSNWLFELSQEEGVDVIHSSSATNPFLPPAFLPSLKASYSSAYYLQEVEGLFVDMESSLFKRHHFLTTSTPPQGLRWVRYWDLAISEKGDYTASLKVAMDSSGTIYIDGGVHMRAGWPEVRRAIIATALSEPGVLVGVEAQGFQLAAFQDLLTVKALASTSMRGVRVDKSKIHRAQPAAARSEAGKLSLVEGSWTKSFLDEVCSFPGGSRHDDWVDALSGAIALLPSTQGAVSLGRGRPIGHRVKSW